MSKTRTRKRTTTQRPHTTATVAHPEPHLRPVPPTGTRPSISLAKPPAPVAAPALESPLYSDLRAEAATATLAAGSLGIPAYFHTWTGLSTSEATCLLDPHNPASVRLIYARHPGRFTATQACRHGAWHAAPIDAAGDLEQFEQTVAGCEDHNPRALRAQALGQGIHRATTAALPTRPTDVRTLREAHAADTDQLKEHSNA